MRDFSILCINKSVCTIISASAHLSPSLFKWFRANFALGSNFSSSWFFILFFYYLSFTFSITINDPKSTPFPLSVSVSWSVSGSYSMLIKDEFLCTHTFHEPYMSKIINTNFNQKNNLTIISFTSTFLFDFELSGTPPLIFSTPRSLLSAT